MALTDQHTLQLDGFLPYVLNRLADRVSQDLSQIYATDYGLTIPEWRVIANIAEHETLHARTIVALTSMEKTKVSRAVNSLTERGLIRQQPSALDSRSRDLALTKAGTAMYRKLVPRVLAWEQELLNGLTSGEQRDLLRLVAKLDRRIQELVEESGGR